MLSSCIGINWEVFRTLQNGTMQVIASFSLSHCESEKGFRFLYLKAFNILY